MNETATGAPGGRSTVPAAAPGRPDFPLGGGKLGALIRDKDWTSTDLGPIETWPGNLRTALGICLDCSFPILIWWGPSFVKLYNDAYSLMIADKHPRALGAPGAAIWPEIWDTIGPMLQRVLEAGEATPADDLRLVLERRGFPEESYFSFSYSPIRDDSGRVAGVFCPVLETTDRVLGERRLAFLLDLERRLRDIDTAEMVKAVVCEKLGRHLGVAQIGYADFDADTDWLTVVMDWNSGRVAPTTGRHRLSEFGAQRAADLRAGMTVAIRDIQTDPRTASAYARGSYAARGVRSVLNVPMIKAGRLVAVLYALDAEPQLWTDAQLALAADVAERVWSWIERIRAERALREQTSQLEAVIRTVPAAVWFTADGRHVTGNRTAAELLRLDDGADMSLAPPDGAVPHVRLQRDGVALRRDEIPLQRAVRGEDVKLEEIDLAFDDGTTICLLSQATPLRNAEGGLAGAVAAAVDITARKQAEAALRDSEEKFRTLAENLPNLCWMAAADGAIYWYNRRWYEYTGTAFEEMQGWGWQKVHDPAMLPEIVARWTACLAEGRAFEMTFPLCGADGTYRPFLTRIVPVRDLAGRITRWFGSNVDISDLERAQAALRESEGSLRGIADAIPGALWAADAHGGITYVGQTWFDFSGATLEATLGHGWGNFVHPEDRDRVAAAWQESLRTGSLYSIEVRLRRRDGAYDWFLVRATPVRDADGAIIRWIGVNVSINEQRQSQMELQRLNENLETRVRQEVAKREQAQLQLAHAQRMEALGQLAGGIAHDFNNVLQAVSGGLGLIQRRADDVEVVRQLAGMAGDAAQRGAAITRRLLAFARKGELKTVLVEPEPLLRDLREILAPTLGSAIAVTPEVAPGTPPFLADRAQLETVLINLAVNGRDAMAEGGTLTVSAQAEIVSDVAMHPAGLASGGYVRLTVTDSGCGMDAATLARASEPFFTTKPLGQGTGLGLAMARGFAQQSGGGFFIRSTPGQGTSVMLWFPCADAPEEIAAAPPPGPRILGVGAAKLVLVVDDDPLVRHVVAGHLEDRGFAIVPASDGLAALAQLDAGAPVDLLVTDLAMPGMNGVRLIEEARRRRPDLPAMLLTGYADAGLVDAGGEGPAGVVVLRKPIADDELAAHAAALLRGEAAGR